MTVKKYKVEVWLKLSSRLDGFPPNFETEYWSVSDRGAKSYATKFAASKVNAPLYMRWARWGLYGSKFYRDFYCCHVFVEECK